MWPGSNAGANGDAIAPHSRAGGIGDTATGTHKDARANGQAVGYAPADEHPHANTGSHGNSPTDRYAASHGTSA
jgi:hypothetical protein